MPEAEEETLEGVATLGPTEPPEREDTATPRGEATEAIGGTRGEAPTKLQLLGGRWTDPRRHRRERQEASDPFFGGCRITG